MLGRTLSLLQAVADVSGTITVVLLITPLAAAALVVELLAKTPALLMVWLRCRAGFTDGRRLQQEMATLRSRFRPPADPAEVTPGERRSFHLFLEKYARARNSYTSN
ncbi:MAG: hypothetical protein AMXMBFR13_47440 [Phycisphaerae bacterium]